MKFKIGVLASGSGSNFEAIAQKIENKYLQSQIVGLIHNNKDAKVAQRAKKYSIPTYHISSKTEGSNELASQKITEIFKNLNVDLIILAGYMKKIEEPLLSEYKGKIINIHPGPLPQFGGEGYFGMNVHRAVIEAKAKQSGPTVHIVDEIYDHGKILSQYYLDVLENETPEHLAQRVLELEHIIFPRVIKDLEDEIIKL